MTIPRALVLVEGESIYHCISRCVRRAYLCGEDFYTGRSYNHRKIWVHHRLILLSKIFVIDVLGYAIMSTHSHAMLRTRPEMLEQLDDKEIVHRWLKLYPRKNIEPGSEKFHQVVDSIISDKKRIKILRARLASISWFMKSLNEYIARKSNKEDECKGKFWEKRFECQRLCDQAAVLSCAVYVDLNPIRAKIAQTPEESTFTSAYERINAITKEERYKDHQKEPELWLSPIEDSKTRKGFLNISLPEYLTILDLSGRELKQGKRGKIPSELCPILERIGIKSQHWLETCNSCRRWFGAAVGSRKSLQAVAASLGKSWLKGFQAAKVAFV